MLASSIDVIGLIEISISPGMEAPIELDVVLLGPLDGLLAAERLSFRSRGESHSTILEECCRLDQGPDGSIFLGVGRD